MRYLTEEREAELPAYLKETGADSERGIHQGLLRTPLRRGVRFDYAESGWPDLNRVAYQLWSTPS